MNVILRFKFLISGHESHIIVALCRPNYYLQFALPWTHPLVLCYWRLACNWLPRLRIYTFFPSFITLQLNDVMRCNDTDMKKIQILTSGIISGDQVAVKRIFSLISRPLNDFKELYYPSFAEWVSCKVCNSIILLIHLCIKGAKYMFLFSFPMRII